MAERAFNISGPVVSAEHYCVDPLSRVDWPDVRDMIDHQQYFVIHAPRRSGKTTVLFEIMRELKAEGRYACAYANIEAGHAAQDDVDQGMPVVADATARGIDLHAPGHDMKRWLDTLHRAPPGCLMSELLQQWAEASDRPTVLLLDEVNALVGDMLISLLRQIRSGYTDRPNWFPHSIVLCAVGDVRDYRMVHPSKEPMTGGSVFNIKSASIRLPDFTEAEIRELYGQHTRETGQRFDEAIFPELWLDTAGQPWFVNALGRETTWADETKRDRTAPITLDDYRDARERLVLSRATPVDQLADKLQEPRVRNIVADLLSGESGLLGVGYTDLEYIADLGLVTLKPSVKLANRLHREIIARELTWAEQDSIPDQGTAWCVTADHGLDVDKLLAAFQRFYRENADRWLGNTAYVEAGPQLLAQAFVQRVVDGVGRICREYALGRKRTDLLIEWPLDEAQGLRGPVQRIVVELRVLRSGAVDALIAQALPQAAEYADQVGADETHLIVFDRTGGTTWDERIWHTTETVGRTIGVWGA